MSLCSSAQKVRNNISKNAFLPSDTVYSYTLRMVTVDCCLIAAAKILCRILRLRLTAKYCKVLLLSVLIMRKK